jgi:hypothetical protein
MQSRWLHHIELSEASKLPPSCLMSKVYPHCVRQKTYRHDNTIATFLDKADQLDVCCTAASIAPLSWQHRAPNGHLPHLAMTLQSPSYALFLRNATRSRP